MNVDLISLEQRSIIFYGNINCGWWIIHWCLESILWSTSSL